MEKKNTLLLTVIAVATLLVAVVGATFAYFGSFTANANANAAINAIITAVTSGGLTFQTFKDGSYTFIVSSEDGTNAYPLTISKDGLSGKFKAGLTGTAEFNNGTYLKFNGGVCTECKTSDGTVIKGGS